MPSFSCPICRRPVQEPAADAPMGDFPFCSDRCKLIDLGRWADEKYQVEVVEENADDEAGPPPRPRSYDDDDDLP